jgi:hypothetical protein
MAQERLQLKINRKHLMALRNCLFVGLRKLNLGLILFTVTIPVFSSNQTSPLVSNEKSASDSIQPHTETLTSAEIASTKILSEETPQHTDEKNEEPKENQESNELDDNSETSRENIGDPFKDESNIEQNNLSIERSKIAIHKGAVNFANWIDGFFGEADQEKSAKYDQLRMVNNFVYLQDQGITYRPRIKAKVNLPKLSKRTSLLFSNKNEGVQQDIEDDKETDNILETGDDEKVSAAINYEGGSYAESKFDFRVGVDSSFEVFSFIRHTLPLIERPSLELKNTNYFFWEDQKGTGISSYIELNSELDPNHLFRWKYGILRSEKSQGNEWRNRLSLVSRLSEDQWVAFELGANGNTDQSFDVENHWLSVRIRNKTSVDWLYAEIEPEFRYSREIDYLERELIFSLTFRLEIQFEEDS